MRWFQSRAIIVIVLLVGMAVAASMLSALHPPEEIPLYADPTAAALTTALVSGVWIATVVGTVGAIILVSRRPQRAAPLLATSLYTLIVGVALVVYGVSAFGGSDAGMGPAVLGGPVVLLSRIVSVISGVVVRHHGPGLRLWRVLIVFGVGTTLTIGWLLLRGPTDWQGALSLSRLHGAPLVLLVVAVSGALLQENPHPDGVTSGAASEGG